MGDYKQPIFHHSQPTNCCSSTKNGFALCDYCVWSDITAHTSNTTLQVCIRYICYDRGWGIDPLIFMEFGRPVTLHHMIRESTHSAHSIEPEGHKLPHLSERCHNAHSEPEYDRMSHTVTMYSYTQQHVKVNREAHICTQVCGYEHMYKNSQCGLK